jgi:hypothetical protein
MCAELKESAASNVPLEFGGNSENSPQESEKSDNSSKDAISAKNERKIEGKMENKRQNLLEEDQFDGKMQKESENCSGINGKTAEF